ncbi:MAG: YeeE/YedE family protein [Hyphomicrobiales bacterium]|nr:YeeE/YedE family protein [Hyphomicrobiales bacterium]MBV8441541.1 YeeE/YedE family protein [Hyphomicrobiales bacterium]
MTIDWTHFTPGSALAGGVLIGLAAAWLILEDGRILGASGLLGGLIPPRAGDWPWRASALAGLIAAPLVASFLFAPAAPSIEANATALIAGGLLVGFGTRLANGCTSGHGVCGLARFSPRSFAATAAFMAAGFLTVFLVRHVI